MTHLYQAVALVAIVNLLAMCGLAGYLFATGRLGSKPLFSRMTDAEVLRILDQLDVRVAKRILEEYSTPELLELLKSLLQQMGAQEAALTNRPATPSAALKRG